MNILFLPIVCLVSLTLAEPPVSDGYPAARLSGHHHDHNDHHDHTSDREQSLSQEYGPPSFATRNAISSEYDAPNARNSPNNRRQTHKHAPTVHVSYNQRSNSAASRSSAHGQNPTNSVDQDYAAFNARRGISEKYGLPESMSLSQEYGVPSPAPGALSAEYDISARSSPAGEYGVPVTRSNQKHPASNFRNQNFLSQDSFNPKSKFQTGFQTDYTNSLVRSNDEGYDAPNSYSKSSDTQSLSQTYGTPKSGPSSTYGVPSRSLSTSYGVPSTRSSDSHSQDYNSISHSYIAPNERDLSEAYEAPNSRSFSQEHSLPSSRSNLKADAVASFTPVTSSRSSPSSSYLPAARDATPSQEYGVPEQDNQGYENSRALGELLNQEPANYDFAYQIEDQESGSDFGHTETRHENRAEGSYFVVLPDGTKQTVEYVADEGGYKPRISIEPAAGGYDGNAQDLARNQGPY